MPLDECGSRRQRIPFLRRGYRLEQDGDAILIHDEPQHIEAHLRSLERAREIEWVRGDDFFYSRKYWYLVFEKIGPTTIKVADSL